MPPSSPEWNKFGQEPTPLEALKSHDLRAALGGFATQHLLQFRRRMVSDGPAIGFGVTLWLLGDTHGAAMVWSKVADEAYKGKYTHSAMGAFQGGLLLWFASVWLKNQDWHDEADQLLEKQLRRKRPVMGATFPSLLAKLLRQEANLQQVESEFSDVPLLREREQSQAYFYAGVRAAEHGDTTEARRLWNEITEPTNRLVELEYFLLVYERERLGR
jgi:hypothetical protein